MKTNKNNSIVLGIASMLALAVSLPLEWMTIRNAKMQFSGGFQGFGDMMSSSLGSMTLKITGMNGHITFLFKVPIWLIVVVGLAGVLLAFLNGLQATSFPRLVPLVPLSLSALYVGIAFIVAVGSSEATVGIGMFVACLGLALGYIHALTCQVSPAESTE